MSPKPDDYYIPHHSHWPIIGAIGLFFLVLGAVNWIHGNGIGHCLMIAGALIVAYMMYGWFSTVIKESQQGLYSEKLDRTFRWAMVWFIFSEVMFFAAFFAALFYARHFAVPWLGGEGLKGSSHLLWNNFQAAWPLLHNPDPAKFPNPGGIMDTWGIPAINTLILLSSGATITWAHFSLRANNRRQLILGLMCTIGLGILFLILQAHEYIFAYSELHLKLSTGIYGTTFFMLTGFHGAHVTIGAIMLSFILIRCLKGHFTPEHHFAFEASAWYWHFVDVVWLCLFIFVYWL